MNTLPSCIFYVFLPLQKKIFRFCFLLYLSFTTSSQKAHWNTSYFFCFYLKVVFRWWRQLFLGVLKVCMHGFTNKNYCRFGCQGNIMTLHCFFHFLILFFNLGGMWRGILEEEEGYYIWCDMARPKTKLWQNCDTHNPIYNEWIVYMHFIIKKRGIISLNVTQKMAVAWGYVVVVVIVIIKYVVRVVVVFLCNNNCILL